MKKFLKWLGILTAAGTAIGILIAYLTKDHANSFDAEDTEFTEDDDYDLDADLKPASEREYVSLNKSAEDDASPEEGDSEAKESETNS